MLGDLCQPTCSACPDAQEMYFSPHTKINVALDIQKYLRNLSYTRDCKNTTEYVIQAMTHDQFELSETFDESTRQRLCPVAFRRYSWN